MIVKLLTEHHLEFVSLKGGYRGSSESTHVKMPHCSKSHAMTHFYNSVSDAANSLNLPTLVSFVDFYNATLDNLDLMQEYAAWQDPTSAGG